ncbi:MAG: hypothetical protein J3K34DRAFT_443970 [Monoraphidium minutum]|nr:MAG: hypothetical protein J3K34DRAFT_443970 [Monoraphidium minutum]
MRKEFLESPGGRARPQRRAWMTTGTRCAHALRWRTAAMQARGRSQPLGALHSAAATLTVPDAIMRCGSVRRGTRASIAAPKGSNARAERSAALPPLPLCRPFHSAAVAPPLTPFPTPPAAPHATPTSLRKPGSRHVPPRDVRKVWEAQLGRVRHAH